jgi:hypothetical protein
VPVDVEPPEKIVDLERRGPEQLRQPPLRRAAEHEHLPQPVLRMGEAEAEEDVRVGLAEDVGHGGRVADDLDRRGDARHGPVGLVIRDRARCDPAEHDDRRHAERDGDGDDPQKPSQQEGHATSGVDDGPGLTGPEGNASRPGEGWRQGRMRV